MTHLLSLLIYYFVRILNLTYRYRYVDLENVKKAKDFSSKGNYLAALWHQNILATLMAHKDIGRHAMIISRSKDGELVARAAELLGNIAVRGSSHRGGFEAKTNMAKYLQEGISGAISVDGPKGPAKESKNGIVELARDIQVAILPIIALPQRYISLKSWDRFRIPIPFTKILVAYAEPIIVDKNLERERFVIIREKIKHELDQKEIYLFTQFSHWNEFCKKTKYF